jgi:hypothetical protein
MMPMGRGSQDGKPVQKKKKDTRKFIGESNSVENVRALPKKEKKERRKDYAI